MSAAKFSLDVLVVVPETLYNVMEDIHLRDLERGPDSVQNDATTSGPKKSWSISTSSTFASRSSNRSRGARSLIHRFTSHKIPDICEDAMPVGRGEFLAYLKEEVDACGIFEKSALWYTKFLEHKFNNFWTLYRRGLSKVNRNDPLPSSDDMTTAYRLLIAVAKNMYGVGDLALVTIMESLINDEMLRDAESEEDREPLFQLVFYCLGWLTMLFEPRALSEQKPGKPNKLRLSKMSLNSPGRQGVSYSRIICERGQNFELVDQPLYNMLGRFGDLIPDCVPKKRFEYAPSSESIATSLCYHTLRQVCHVEIEWVDTLNLHLEFDTVRMVLKLYRLPSFGLIMYRNKKKRGLLDQLFRDKANYVNGSGCGPRIEAAATTEFFRELLLTYRLIFGQHPESWKLFASEMAQLSKPGMKPLLSLDDADPLLPILCGRSYTTSDAQEVYEYIRADDIHSYNTPDSFPFFGRRILAIKTFVGQQQPPDWRSLWHDKRNKTNWWAFWAVLFIGGATIILMLLSLVFQIWQIILAQAQLKQGASGPS